MPATPAPAARHTSHKFEANQAMSTYTSVKRDIDGVLKLSPGLMSQNVFEGLSVVHEAGSLGRGSTGTYTAL